ncbi:hypothetical protein O9A_01462 [Bartonella koehlerae C-29]|uniref:Uncharacterized protein n=1 Tax=Bartonella koehlerae C-29 TaxID=1134510 RepID=A0A067WB48_9HYPH|nr:hypothetical protein O9A_01462 [Bartonella koehlerae C-29]
MTTKQVKPIKAERLNRYYEESLGLERELIGTF